MSFNSCESAEEGVYILNGEGGAFNNSRVPAFYAIYSLLENVF